MHLERDHAEGAAAQRDVGRDVRFVRIGWAHDDELALEVEQVARSERAVRVDPQRGTAERVARDDERRPSREPCQAAVADADLDPGERCLEERGERGVLVSRPRVGCLLPRVDARVACLGRQDDARKTTGELLPKLADSRGGKLGKGAHLNLRPV